MPRRVACCLALVFLLVAGSPAVAAADLPSGATWVATVNGRSVKTTSTSDPIQLAPPEPVTIKVKVENHSPTPVAARYVRLEGGVLGLKFYVFTTTVDLQAPPGATDEREFTVDLLDLESQASGLLPSRIVLLDAAGGEMAAEPLLVDIRGSVSSVYSGFGLAVGGITILLVVGALWRLARGRLPRNRWRRGLVMAAPGLGIGFTLTFTLSALRWAAPSGGMWTTFLLLGAVAGFVAGYLSPTPDDAEPGDGADTFAGPDEPRPVDDDGYVVDVDDGAGEDEEQDEDLPAAVGNDSPWWRSR
jgi:hypothetical protein